MATGIYWHCLVLCRIERLRLHKNKGQFKNYVILFWIFKMLYLWGASSVHYHSCELLLIHTYCSCEVPLIHMYCTCEIHLIHIYFDCAVLLLIHVYVTWESGIWFTYTIPLRWGMRCIVFTCLPLSFELVFIHVYGKCEVFLISIYWTCEAYLIRANCTSYEVVYMNCTLLTGKHNSK